MKQRKTFRSVLSIVLALIMCVSLPMAAFADNLSADEIPEGTTVGTPVDNGDGTSTTTTTVKETVPGSDGDVTVTITVKETTTTNDPNANPQTTTQKETTTVTTTDANGEQIYKQEAGSTTETTVTDDPNGSLPGQPEIELELEVGGTTTAQGGVNVLPPVGDLPEGEDDMEYDYSQVTDIERTASGTVSDVVVDEHIAEGALELKTPEVEQLGGRDVTGDTLGDVLDNKDGVSPGPYGKKPMNSAKHFDTVTVNGVTTYVPAYTRSPAEYTELIEKFPTLSSSYKAVDEDKDGTVDYYKSTHAEKNTIPTHGDGFDAAYATNAELSDYNLLFEDHIVYYKDGQVVYDSNWNASGSGNLLLYDSFGNPIVTYCLDRDTGTIAGTSSYVIENLEDATYFSGTEEEQAEKKEHVAAIAIHGYWGTSSEKNEDGSFNQGSLAKIQEELAAFIEANEDFQFDYVVPNYENPEDQSNVKTLSVADNKDELLALVDFLNEGAALTATQWAFWTYGNRDVNAVVGAGDPNNNSGDPDATTRAIALMHAWLLSDELKDASPNTANTIVDGGVIDSMTLTIGDQVADAAENKDDNHDNDVYNTELSFTMKVNEDKDDLVVTLYDANGNAIRKARIAGTATEEEKNDSLFSKLFRKDKETDTYTFEGLQLSENSDITFDLRIDGIQHLESGVYIYKSSDGNYDTAQTLVGLASGKRDVDLDASFVINFNVDESNVETNVRKWSYDPITEKDPEETTPPPPVFFEPVPLMDEPEEEIVIEEEPVPLAKAPSTGSLSAIFAIAAATSGMGLAGLAVTAKRKDEE